MKGGLLLGAPDWPAVDVRGCLAMIRKLTCRAALLLTFVLAAISPGRAALPPELAAAVENLRAQHSYAWEIINGDPGPVEQNIETVRGTVKSVQRNQAPHVKGRVSASGEMLIERDWPDGMSMQTFVAADGAMVTKTPDGWLTQQEILEAIAAERLRPDGASPRAQWLPRAEAVDTQRPAEKLAPFVGPQSDFELSGDAYVNSFRVQTGNPATAGKDDSQSVGSGTLTIHLEGGVLRDFELKSEIAHYLTRARIPVVDNNDLIVILSYIPVGRINVPEEARAKLRPGRP